MCRPRIFANSKNTMLRQSENIRLHGGTFKKPREERRHTECAGYYWRSVLGQSKVVSSEDVSSLREAFSPKTLPFQRFVTA